jgi:hypothetical protein
MYGIFHPPTRASKAASKQAPELGYIILETFGTTRLLGKERSFPKELCDLELCRSTHFNSMYNMLGHLYQELEDTELRLKVHGDSSYWLGLDGALINGKPASDVLAARDSLLELIQGENVGRWKAGPIVKATS